MKMLLTKYNSQEAVKDSRRGNGKRKRLFTAAKNRALIDEKTLAVKEIAR
jgi:hypothetical protein